MHDVAWESGRWLTEPARVGRDGPDLLVTPAARSDLWRTTGYGFVHDDAPALLTPLPVGAAVEVTFVAALSHRYDQAGVLVRVDPTTWTKAGVEFADGEAHVGAVVTAGRSDWSLAPVPDWAGLPVTVRVSRTGGDADGPDEGALAIRARVGDQPWRLIRLAPLASTATASAGPYCCSPEHGGLTVRFTRFAVGPADESLHDETPHADPE